VAFLRRSPSTIVAIVRASTTTAFPRRLLDLPTPPRAPSTDVASSAPLWAPSTVVASSVLPQAPHATIRSKHREGGRESGVEREREAAQSKERSVYSVQGKKL
jgi:hypothetical protein